MDYITQRNLLNHIEKEYSTREFWHPITPVLHTDYACPTQVFAFDRSIDFNGKRYYCQIFKEIIFEPDNLEKVKHVFNISTSLRETPYHLTMNSEENAEYAEEDNDFDEIDSLELKIASLEFENNALREKLAKYVKTYGDWPED